MEEQEPSAQENANAKHNTEQRALITRVKNKTALVVDINWESASFVSHDRSNAAKLHAIELHKEPGVIDLLPDNDQENVQARLKGYDKKQNDKKVKNALRNRDEFDARTHRENIRTIRPAHQQGW